MIKLFAQTYDKHWDLNFAITNFPHLHGNISRNQALSVFSSQIERYTYLCSKEVDFIKNCKRLALNLLHRGYSKRSLRKQYRSALKNKPWLYHKYNGQHNLHNLF